MKVSLVALGVIVLVALVLVPVGCSVLNSNAERAANRDAADGARRAAGKFEQQLRDLVVRNKGKGPGTVVDEIKSAVPASQLLSAVTDGSGISTDVAMYAQSYVGSEQHMAVLCARYSVADLNHPEVRVSDLACPSGVVHATGDVFETHLSG
jgi:hypothetical protein